MVCDCAVSYVVQWSLFFFIFRVYVNTKTGQRLDTMPMTIQRSLQRSIRDSPKSSPCVKNALHTSNSDAKTAFANF